MEFRILHLSDLHLGDDYFVRSLLRGRLWLNKPDRPLLDNLARTVRELKPHYVVVSGDIVNKCTAETFAVAATALKSLFTAAGVDITQKVLIIPGNHDVTVLPERHEYFGRVREFNHFLKHFFEAEDYRSRKERFTLVDRDAKICFVCLDSTLKQSVQAAEGMIGTPQLKWLEKKFERLRALHPDLDQFVKIAVLHHHPHAIARAGNDRFMQLLDAGEVIQTFQSIRANIVLHGHKHYPHVLEHRYQVAGSEGGDGAQHYTVIGAGTACCPWLEEQAGEGNNFNLLRIRPRANMLSVDRYKADNSKTFRLATTFGPYPLRPPSPRGYRILEYHTSTVIQNLDGDCSIIDRRKGLIVDANVGNERRQIAFGFGGLPATAEIVDFRSNSQDVEEVRFEKNLPHERKGVFVLKYPLRWGGDPIDLEYTCTIRRGVRMKRQSPDEGRHERAVLTVIHPCDRIILDVQFPPQFRATPQIQIRDENLQPQRPMLSERLEYDELSNRHTLIVEAPKLGFEYSLGWQVI